MLSRFVTLRGLRPLLSACGCGAQATRPQHSSVSDSDEEVDLDVAAAFMAELRQDAMRLAAGAAGPDLDSTVEDLLGSGCSDPEVPVEAQRVLQTGVVGVPNAGKSTLVNALVGHKVSAASPKTNTTEQTRLGAYTVGASQVLLFDTPGVVGPQHFKSVAHQQRVRSAWTVASECDLLLFLVDAARELQRPDPRLHRMLAHSCSAASIGMPPSWHPPPAVLVLNKCDAIPPPRRPRLLPLSDTLRGLRQFDDVFYVSAKDGRGLPELQQYLLDRAKPGEWLLDASMATDRCEEEQALEVVRELLFLRLYKELPYEIRLRLTSCLSQQDGSLSIEIEALVGRESQKKILVGSSGATISSIAHAASQELQKMWDTPVSLGLKVKVEKPR